MTGNFYNTIQLDIFDHRQRIFKAESQTGKVLEFFKAHPEKEFTPFEVLEGMGINAPITSIRRAITDLTDASYLYTTKIKREGRYGTLNLTWRLRK